MLDPDFNLHLREDQIDTAWVVRKPTRDGDVTSLELFDKDGFCFAQLFGARKPGKPELQGWRDLLAALPRSRRDALMRRELAPLLLLMAGLATEAERGRTYRSPGRRRDRDRLRPWAKARRWSASIRRRAIRRPSCRFRRSAMCAISRPKEFSPAVRISCLRRQQAGPPAVLSQLASARVQLARITREADRSKARSRRSTQVSSCARHAASAARDCRQKLKAEWRRSRRRSRERSDQPEGAVRDGAGTWRSSGCGTDTPGRRDDHDGEGDRTSRPSKATSRSRAKPRPRSRPT